MLWQFNEFNFFRYSLHIMGFISKLLIPLISSILLLFSLYWHASIAIIIRSSSEEKRFFANVKVYFSKKLSWEVSRWKSMDWKKLKTCAFYLRSTWLPHVNHVRWNIKPLLARPRALKISIYLDFHSISKIQVLSSILISQDSWKLM